MSKVVCRARGYDEITNAVNYLDDHKVQILYSKFPVGSGTFKRNKFIFVQYIGPECGVVKRGKAITTLSEFTDTHLYGVPGFATADKSCLTFEYLVEHMSSVFVSDNVEFSMEQIKDEYRARLKEERKMMHREAENLAAREAAKKRREARAARPQVKVAKAKRKKKEVPPEPQMDPKQLTEVTGRVLKSLREPDGPINWAVFAADPSNLAVQAYGRGGIFELVKNLPDNKWLFGLFRISFNINDKRERRIILFQWIGNNYRASRNTGRSGVYRGMTKLLAPYNYEIYLVGKGDLNAHAIITKSKAAFADVASPNLNSTVSSAPPQVSPPLLVCTEEAYKETLIQEINETKDVPFEVFIPKLQSHNSSVITDDLDTTASTALSFVTESTQFSRPIYDVEETIQLIQAREGGLVWGVFDVA